MKENMQGIYGCYDGEKLMYVGSSGKNLAELEYNHRNWKKLNFSGTDFRVMLDVVGHDWTFKWLQSPRFRSKPRIEIEEGVLIRVLKPLYNRDMDPYSSSVNFNRYEKLV